VPHAPSKMTKNRLTALVNLKATRFVEIRTTASPNVGLSAVLSTSAVHVDFEVDYRADSPILDGYFCLHGLCL